MALEKARVQLLDPDTGKVLAEVDVLTSAPVVSYVNDNATVRDFRGISPKAFDGRGNYTLGIKEQTIFPEIVYDEVVKVRGMDIVFVTSAKTNEEALDLLKGFGLPFRK